MVECETFEELKMSEVRGDKAKLFLRMRRIRVLFGQGVLLICSVRLLSYLLIIPSVNVVLRIMQSELRYKMDLASTGEYWFLGVVCSALLIIYKVETKVKNRMIQEWEEEGN